MQYRRSFLPGGTFFFTVVTADRQPLFAEQKNIATLREAFRTIRLQRPFSLDAAVVLPDHLHCIWTLPHGDADFSTRWRLIKTWFTKHCDSVLRAEARNARTDKGERLLWQHRYWEHMLRDETDYRHHVEYIHFNPVKHGYVKAPLDWPYSSFRRYVKAGVYPPDWGGGLPEFNGVGQE
jgi:REP-associated tyrosine transposase